jgi:protein-S-isoprenylcysteine O-methyltransferase Ste14
VRSTARDWLKEHGQTLFNLYLFITFGIWVGWQTWQTWREGRLNYVEVAFAAQSVILVVLLLVRLKHRAVDRNPLHQAVALVAFCSGLFFIGQAPTGGKAAMTVSEVIVFVANVAGAVTLLNLGRSFGILIAYRKIRTGGLYSVVRHPMYGTDILLRIGFLVSHFTPVVVSLFVLSTGCYVWRAILEERFLSREPEYREYTQKVRYRFLPGVF